ncbi:MAG: 1-acyl-sn-glycerol-3-phosphate acyltransferase [Solirubrobacteraceae bacterium]
MPSALIRRPLTITAWVVASVLLLAFSPVLLGVAAVIGAITGRPLPTILARLLISYCAYELGTLIACGLLWVLALGGLMIERPRIQALHWALVRSCARAAARRCRRLLSIDVTREDSGAAVAALRSERPLLMLSRHAGPGDTVLLLDALMSEWDRRPSIVFKRALVIDPCIDLVAHRLPQAIVDAGDEAGAARRIEQLAGSLRPRGIIVLFPEGGNFSVERRRRAIRRLTRKGHRAAAARARQMRHVVAPHPSGVRAALAGNPDLPVVFAAHTGLGLAAQPGELWREPPLGRTLRTRMWLVTPQEVPSAEAELAEWLNDWWARIDRWIDAQQTEVEC